MTLSLIARILILLIFIGGSATQGNGQNFHCPFAAEGPAAVRAAYEAEVRALEDQGLAARAAGQDAETTARQLVDARNALKVAARAQSPADAVAQMEARNMAKYGNPVGPTADQLHAARKTWEQIIESASRPGGSDLGF